MTSQKFDMFDRILTKFQEIKNLNIFFGKINLFFPMFPVDRPESIRKSEVKILIKPLEVPNEA